MLSQGLGSIVAGKSGFIAALSLTTKSMVTWVSNVSIFRCLSHIKGVWDRKTVPEIFGEP
jgi:hypothetical protein